MFACKAANYSTIEINNENYLFSRLPMFQVTKEKSILHSEFLFSLILNTIIILEINKILIIIMIGDDNKIK